MGNIGSSLLLLVVAVFILWLAVTGRIQALPDAWNTIIHGTDGATGGAATGGTVNPVKLSLPALPVFNPTTVTT